MGNYYSGMMANEKSLYHHGIKGQKWGVRRYQNPDGTLTAEGRARYLEGNYQNSVNRLHKAWSNREADGRNYERYSSDSDTPMDLASKGDKWKRLRNRMDEINDTLRPDRHKVAMLEDRMRTLNPIGLRDKRRQYMQASDDLQKKAEKLVQEFIGESLAYIDQLPEKDREAYESYVYELLGWDW